MMNTILQYSLMRHGLLIIFTFIYIAIMPGCSRYSISVNDNVVYEPPALFQEYTITDASLKQCIQETIAESRLTSAEQLTQLICPKGDIRSLVGIEVFSSIEQLGLADNALTRIGLLNNLPKLKQLNLSNNDIHDFSVIFQLKELKYLSAERNKHADCESLQLPKQKMEIIMPSHCQ